MEKFNFDKNVTDLAGDVIPHPQTGEPLTLGSQLAPAIAQHTGGDAVKLFGWALALYKKEELVLDKSDQNTLREFIQTSQMSVLMKAQLLEVINQ